MDCSADDDWDSLRGAQALRGCPTNMQTNSLSHLMISGPQCNGSSNKVHHTRHYVSINTASCDSGIASLAIFDAQYYHFRTEHVEN